MPAGLWRLAATAAATAAAAAAACTDSSPPPLRAPQTGKYCRVAADPADSKTKVICDQDTPATATPLTFTGYGVEYQGQPLINPGNNGSIYLGGPTDAGTPLTFTPPPLPTNMFIKVLGAGGEPVRNDNATSAAYVGGGDGTSPYEQYLAYDPADLGSTTPVQPGQTTILKNVSHATQPQRARQPSKALRSKGDAQGGTPAAYSCPLPTALLRCRWPRGTSAGSWTPACCPPLAPSSSPTSARPLPSAVR